MKKGFTLVELAIVMTIIGLLIGGILKGQELIKQARVTSTIRDLKGYQAAVITFQDVYAALPGDIAAATSRIPGCTAAISCRNGNGDGFLGVLPTEWFRNVPSTIATENTQFWKHLALANLASGIDPTVSATADIAWGKSHPASPAVTGGLMATSAAASVDPSHPTDFSGLIVLSRLNKSGAYTNGPDESFNSISSQVARQMDTKMDDGVSTTGGFQSKSRGWALGCGRPLLNGHDATGYRLDSKERDCDIGYRLK